MEKKKKRKKKRKSSFFLKNNKNFDVEPQPSRTFPGHPATASCCRGWHPAPSTADLEISSLLQHGWRHCRRHRRSRSRDPHDASQCTFSQFFTSMSQTYQNRRNSRWVSAFTNHNLPQRPRILPKPPPQLLLPTTPLFHPTRLPSRPHQESSSAVSAKCPSIPSQQRLNSLQVCVQAKKKKDLFLNFILNVLR